ncbi:MAG: Rid family detoxifying hydrolase [Patescibacteria group bacterium]
MKKLISTDKAPGTPSLLSQAIEANGFVFTSGFIHTTLEGKLVEGTIEDKVRQIMKNLEAVLAAAQVNFDDVVKVIVWVTDIADLPKVNEVYKTYFTEPLPAREGICVKALPLGASIEISMIAAK